MIVRTYKFVSSVDAVINIGSGRLKFTAIPELNDPTEMIPIMNHSAVRHSLEQLRETGFSKEQFEWLSHQGAVLRRLAPEMQAIPVPTSIALANAQVKSAFYNDIGRMERLLERTVSTIRDKVGVLCLSARFNSLPMWSHYANQGAGFAVAFRDLHETFPGDETGSLNTLKEVQYTSEFLGMTFDPTTQDRLFFSKLRDWDYEREWRVVCALADCEIGSLGANSLRTIDRRRVEAVICGWRVSDDATRRISDDLAKNNPDVMIVSARIERGRIVLMPSLT